MTKVHIWIAAVSSVNIFPFIELRLMAVRICSIEHFCLNCLGMIKTITRVNFQFSSLSYNLHLKNQQILQLKVYTMSLIWQYPWLTQTDDRIELIGLYIFASLPLIIVFVKLKQNSHIDFLIIWTKLTGI